MTTRRQGRGATGSAALGLFAVLGLVTGLVLIAVSFLVQVPDPPRPASATTAAETPRPANARATETPRTGTPQADNPRADARDDTARTDASTTPAPMGADRPERPATVAPLTAAEPLAVRVPAIGAESPLHALGLAPDGTLEVPSRDLVDQAAWYSGSPTPGEVGPSVVEGHVTGPGGRPSVFFELAALAPGDTVEVDRADGRTVVFEVYRVDSFPKDAFPTVAVYGPTAGPELRLITCGGEFDDATGHHVDNTVVFARAVDTNA